MYRQPMPRLRPNTESLSVDERGKAQMVRAGKTAYRKGFAAAQAEIGATTATALLVQRSLATGASASAESKQDTAATTDPLSPTAMLVAAQSKINQYLGKDWQAWQAMS